ncbi:MULTISPECIES: GTPase domain-containing protein [unclassified Actinomyces]|uniref:GTPase domain-containing protein n=1 Tax=unclassified Actinomyces TaxID=2609248 RepID=UPI002016AA8E|nr:MULTISPECIES: GTPase domain-containing protein [unclassified Actinomyces]MCL3776791.1 GTPase domain-containing protein [Actinomyces sp. AC-20-1]MCL3789885.1 GTPase domain-containing protein [Actinomyces sp. 187325]MCL3792222.1 GTPase domain-containing protein [Actinomyces sp. 186855]MCL3794784.1 GTPase domain-containing protein [Actinomyces sp. 217892]
MPPSRPQADGLDVPSTVISRGRLIDVLSDTVRDLEALPLTLAADGVDDARRLRASVAGQLRDHVLPRLEDADVPAVVVVGGSTGAGKSTLVNSVLGTEVSEAGVLRPTTRVPVLVVNPEDASALEAHPVSEVVQTVVCEAQPAGLALIDASDLDSVQADNRALAARLLEACDLWLFVTTAARYGDHTPWATLEEAVSRGASIAVVLNRVPAAVLSEVRLDLVERLDGLGLAGSPFFVVPDVGPYEGLLPAGSVRELRDWMQLLAGRHRAAGLVRRADRELWPALRHDLLALADAVDAQGDAGRRLEQAGRDILAGPCDALRADVERGGLAEGAPTTRWVSHASAGGPLAALATGARLRGGWFGRTARARAQALAEVADDLRGALALRLSADLTAVTEEARTTWSEAGATEHAGRLLGHGPGAHEAVTAWVEGVVSTAAPVKGMEAQAVGHLLVAAACGLEGARAAAARLGLAEAVGDARPRLAEALTAALEAAVPARAGLSLVPAPDLAAALRLRAGELSVLVRPGDQ